MNSRIYQTKLDALKGREQTLKKWRASKNKELKTTEQELEYTDEAMVLMQEVAMETQGQLQIHIQDLVTSALESVLDDPYQFVVEFVVRNNKTECDIYFERDGERVKPLLSSGGGAVDIASFASRLALWSLGDTSNTLIFDEPFRFVSAEYQAKIGEMLNSLAKTLGLQIIQVTHNPVLVEHSDKIFKVCATKGVSTVEVK